MFVSAIPCGNHYLMDVLGGLVVALLAIALGAMVYPRLRGDSRRSASSEAVPTPPT
jgi:membrane-associated phospholipid phosphatase